MIESVQSFTLMNKKAHLSCFKHSLEWTFRFAVDLNPLKGNEV